LAAEELLRKKAQHFHKKATVGAKEEKSQKEGFCMGTATRRILPVEEHTRIPVKSNGNGHRNGEVTENGTGNGSHGNGAQRKEQKPRVFVAAENRLLREALSRMLSKGGEIEVVGGENAGPLQKDVRLRVAPLLPVTVPEDAEILLLSSKGNLDQDLDAIRKIRSVTPDVLILLIDVTGDETTFLQCIRAGVRGYLPREASAEDVVEAVLAVHAGKAVCPGALCATLFRYMEREATCFPSAAVHQKLGLTRREQQLIPLVAEGLTNKEIANHFCLSEQTVKNHLYRMKQKIGADDRLSIVQMCRTQGFMV